MLRTSLPLNYIKRTFRPLYGWTQATPKSGFLDPTWGRSVAIFPGMVVTKTAGNNYTLIGSGAGTSDLPAGFIAQFVGGNGVDELLEAGINAIGVWQLGPDAEFEVLAPAFDPTQSWGETTAGQDVLVAVSVSGLNQGQLVPVGGASSLTLSGTGTSGGSSFTVSSKAVARLVQVESPSSIIIGGLATRTL